MNFLVLGTPFLLFMLNFDWSVSYAVKLVGAIFMLVGMYELKNEMSHDNKLKKYFTACLGFSAAGGIVILVMRLLSTLGESVKNVSAAANAFALLIWGAAVIIPLYCIAMLYGYIDDNRDKLTDTVNLVKLGFTLKKVYIVTVFAYVSNVIYVLLPYRQTADFFAVLMIIGKITLYVLIIVSTVRFFKVRIDYYIKNAEE